MRKQVSYRTAARIGTAIMVAILAGTVALTLAALVWSREGVPRWKTAGQVSHAYNETAMNAALAAIHWSHYVREGDEGQLAAFERALRAAMDAEEQVKLIGTAADRAFLADMERRYATELLTAVQAAEANRRGSFDPDALAGTTTLTEAV